MCRVRGLVVRINFRLQRWNGEFLSNSFHMLCMFCTLSDLCIIGLGDLDDCSLLSSYGIVIW